MTKYTYEILDGFFENAPWDENVKGAFGLQPPPGDWHAFADSIKRLLAATLPNQSIKVIYMGRHGQSIHNLQAEEDGLSYTESQRRNPTPDPKLSPLGREQSVKLAEALQREIKRGMSLPEVWFVSPLQRAAATCELAWSWLFEGGDANGPKSSDAGTSQQNGVPARVVENLRERLHVHPSDRRSTLTEIRRLFPSFVIPDDMTETDELWMSEEECGEKEPIDQLRARGATVWEEMFDLAASETYISVTCHGTLMRSILVVLGFDAEKLERRKAALGSVRVLVIKVSETDGK